MLRRKWISSVAAKTAYVTVTLPPAILFASSDRVRQAAARQALQRWFAIQPAEAVFCGDSHLALISPSAVSERWGRLTTLNLAVPGATAAEVIAQVADAAGVDTRRIVVMAGTNDLAGHDEDLVLAWSLLLNPPKRHPSARYVMVSLPLRLDPAFDARIRTLNAELRRRAIDANWKFIDVNEFIPLRGQSRSESFRDAVHLAEPVERLLIDELARLP